MAISTAHEKPLLFAAVFFSTLFWLGLTAFLLVVPARHFTEFTPEYTAGALIVLLILTYVALFLRRLGLAAYLRGHAVEIGPKQFADLHTRLKAVTKRLEIGTEPLAFVFHHPSLGGDSFSVRYGGQEFLALHARLLEVSADHHGVLDFFLGSEIGRQRDRHTRWAPFLFPATLLPMLGPACARAQRYFRDRYGLVACKTKQDAVLALALLALGGRTSKSFSAEEFMAQGAQRRRFWISLRELVSAEPWLNKRLARLHALASGGASFIARRHPLAFLLALFTPYLAPRARGGFLRLLFVPLWVAVLAFATVSGYQLLVERGVLESIESRFQNKAVDLPNRPAGLASAPSVMATSPPSGRNEDIYAKLHADLKLLGDIAAERSKKTGGIPCEVGNISALKLHYRASRYAFSCNEPTVYTAVEVGEFEVGRPSHLRVYHWKESRFLPVSVDPPPAPE